MTGDYGMDVDDEAEKKAKKWLLLGSLSSIPLSIYSFINILTAYLYLTSIQADFLTLVDHWESKPVIDIALISADSANNECPKGYSEGIVKNNDRNVDQTIGEWPGKYPWCECKDGDGFTHTFDYNEYRCNCDIKNLKCVSSDKCSHTTTWGAGQCDSQALSQGCKTESQSKTKSVSYFTKKGVCTANATLAGCRTDNNIDSIALHYWQNKRICYKRGGWSAVERVQYIDESTNSCTKGVVCQAATESQDEIYTICAPSKDECPLVMIGAIPSQNNHGSQATFKKIKNANEYQKLISNSESHHIDIGKFNYRPIVEFRMTIGTPCWQGEFGQKGRSNNERVKNKYDDTCQVKDKRFQIWDEINEPLLYNQNHIPVTGHNLLGDGHTYTKYQYFNQSTDVNWTLSYRPEIFWENDCEAGNIKHLANYLNPLMSLTTLEKFLVVFHCIFGLILLGLFLPSLTILHALQKNSNLICVPGSGKTERRNLNVMTGTLKVISTFAKFIPLIWAYIVTTRIHWFFTTAASGNCSDNLTNDTMLHMGNEIDRLKQSHFRNIIVDSILVFWTGITIAKEIRDYRKMKHSEHERLEVSYDDDMEDDNHNNNDNKSNDYEDTSDEHILWHQNESSTKKKKHHYLTRFLK